MKLSREDVKQVLLILTVLAFFYYVAGLKADQIKQDLNTAVRVQCESGNTNAILEKYNDVVTSLVQHERVSEQKDQADGLHSNAANDAALIQRLKADEVPIVKPDCSKPYLP